MSFRYTGKHMQDEGDLQQRAQAVLSANDRGSYTMPAALLYPHQWLWDSCFTAIGLSHIDTERAQTEITSLFRGQWHNGMLPNIVFRDEAKYRADREVWRSRLNPFAPDGIATSGITQPPMIAEAVVRIGEKLGMPERRSWYRSVWPHLLAYHQWLYRERNPHDEGLIVLVHPWEAGLDNTPPWMAELHRHLMPGWIRALETLKLMPLITRFRRDTKYVPLDERFETAEVLAMFDIQRRLRRKDYRIDAILNHAMFAIEDLSFNCILIRANEHLRAIAEAIGEKVPEELLDQMELTATTLDNLRDGYTKEYYSRDFVTHRLLTEPSIATFLPLYAGTISKEHAAELVKLLEDERQFGPAYPIPSVPVTSEWFQPRRYWQGPTWVNMNWLIIDGLKRYGYNDHAAALAESTIEMVDKSGFAEYFNPLTGEPAGGGDFSWTAALIIDLLHARF